MAPMPTYCTPEMADFLTNNGPWGLMVSEGRLDLRPVVSGEWNRIADQLQARALLVPHRPEYSDTVGWVFRGPTQTILYLPDIDSWERWEVDVEDVVASVDVVLLDASFYSADEVPGRNIEGVRHPLVPHSMDRLQDRVDAGDRVVFTHLNNTNPALFEDSREAAEVRRRGFEIAGEGSESRFRPSETVPGLFFPSSSCCTFCECGHPFVRKHMLFRQPFFGDGDNDYAPYAYDPFDGVRAPRPGSLVFRCQRRESCVYRSSR